MLAEVGETWQPKGATAIVMDPRSGAILALANWPRVNANDARRRARLRAPEPRGRRHLRARLDLQGVHRRRRARGAARSRRTRRSTCRRRSRSPTARSARRTRAATVTLTTRRDPQAVLERRRGHDRPAARRQALRPVGAALRLRQADRRRPAGRGERHRAPARASTRAPRWATCRSARASRSRRCRWRPRYSAIANGGILRPPHIVAAGRRQGDRRRTRATA